MEKLIKELQKLGFKLYGDDCYSRLIGHWGIEFYFPESRMLVIKNLLGSCKTYKDVDSIEKVNAAMDDYYNNN